MNYHETLRFYLYLSYSLKCPLACFSITPSRISTFSSNLSKYSNVLLLLQFVSQKVTFFLCPVTLFCYLHPPPTLFQCLLGTHLSTTTNLCFYSASQSLFRRFPPMELCFGKYRLPLTNKAMGFIPLVSRSDRQTWAEVNLRISEVFKC